jgi:hypothetical protein
MVKGMPPMRGLRAQAGHDTELAPIAAAVIGQGTSCDAVAPGEGMLGRHILDPFPHCEQNL